MKQERLWIDGKLVDRKKYSLDPLSYSFHYGTAVFEGIRFYSTQSGRAIFRLNDHLDRLYASTFLINIKVKYSKKRLADAIKNLVRSSPFNQGYIRPLVFYGYGELSLNPSTIPTHVMITIWPWRKYHEKKTLKIMTSSYIRPHPRSVPMQAKVTGFYVNSILATTDAQKKGFDEALLLDYKGYIAEGSVENIFIAENNVLYTPKKDTILPGITRDSIIKICKDYKIRIIEKDITLKEAYSADEVFFTGTAAEIAPIGKIDVKKIRNGRIGPITERLQRIFYEIVSGRNKRYKNWIEIV